MGGVISKLIPEKESPDTGDGKTPINREGDGGKEVRKISDENSTSDTPSSDRSDDESDENDGEKEKKNQKKNSNEENENNFILPDIHDIDDEEKKKTFTRKKNENDFQYSNFSKSNVMTTLSTLEWTEELEELAAYEKCPYSKESSGIKIIKFIWYYKIRDGLNEKINQTRYPKEANLGKGPKREIRRSEKFYDIFFNNISKEFILFRRVVDKRSNETNPETNQSGRKGRGKPKLEKGDPVILVPVRKNSEIGSTVGVLRNCHDDLGHPGRGESSKVYSRRIFYSGQSVDMKNHVTNCPECIKKPHVKSKYFFPPLPKMKFHLPFETVQLDLYQEEMDGNGFQYVCHVKSKTLNIQLFFPLKTKESEIYLEVIKILHKIIRFRRLEVDNGTEIVNHLVQTWCEENDVILIPSAVRNPKARGGVERSHTTGRVRCYVGESDNFSENLASAMDNINTKNVCRSNGDNFTPFYCAEKFFLEKEDLKNPGILRNKLNTMRKWYLTLEYNRDYYNKGVSNSYYKKHSNKIHHLQKYMIYRIIEKKLKHRLSGNKYVKSRYGNNSGIYIFSERIRDHQTVEGVYLTYCPITFQRKYSKKIFYTTELDPISNPPYNIVMAAREYCTRNNIECNLNFAQEFRTNNPRPQEFTKSEEVDLVDNDGFVFAQGQYIEYHPYFEEHYVIVKNVFEFNNKRIRDTLLDPKSWKELWNVEVTYAKCIPYENVKKKSENPKIPNGELGIGTFDLNNYNRFFKKDDFLKNYNLLKHKIQCAINESKIDAGKVKDIIVIPEPNKKPVNEVVIEKKKVEEIKESDEKNDEEEENEGEGEEEDGEVIMDYDSEFQIGEEVYFNSFSGTFGKGRVIKKENTHPCGKIDVSILSNHLEYVWVELLDIDRDEGILLVHKFLIDELENNSYNYFHNHGYYVILRRSIVSPCKDVRYQFHQNLIGKFLDIVKKTTNDGKETMGLLFGHRACTVDCDKPFYLKCKYLVIPEQISEKTACTVKNHHYKIGDHYLTSKDSSLIGWIHTHPIPHGLFFSATDIFCHFNLQRFNNMIIGIVYSDVIKNYLILRIKDEKMKELLDLEKQYGILNKNRVGKKLEIFDYIQQKYLKDGWQYFMVDASGTVDGSQEGESYCYEIKDCREAKSMAGDIDGLKTSEYTNGYPGMCYKLDVKTLHRNDGIEGVFSINEKTYKMDFVRNCKLGKPIFLSTSINILWSLQDKNQYRNSVLKLTTDYGIYEIEFGSTVRTTDNIGRILEKMREGQDNGEGQNNGEGQGQIQIQTAVGEIKNISTANSGSSTTLTIEETKKKKKTRKSLTPQNFAIVLDNEEAKIFNMFEKRDLEVTICESCIDLLEEDSVTSKASFICYHCNQPICRKCVGKDVYPYGVCCFDCDMNSEQLILLSKDMDDLIVKKQPKYIWEAEAFFRNRYQMKKIKRSHIFGLEDEKCTFWDDFFNDKNTNDDDVPREENVLYSPSFHRSSWTTEEAKKLALYKVMKKLNLFFDRDNLQSIYHFFKVLHGDIFVQKNENNKDLFDEFGSYLPTQSDIIKENHGEIGLFLFNFQEIELLLKTGLLSRFVKFEYKFNSILFYEKLIQSIDNNELQEFFNGRKEILCVSSTKVEEKQRSYYFPNSENDIILGEDQVHLIAVSLKMKKNINFRDNDFWINGIKSLHTTSEYFDCKRIELGGQNLEGGPGSGTGQDGNKVSDNDHKTGKKRKQDDLEENYFSQNKKNKRRKKTQEQVVEVNLNQDRNKESTDNQIDNEEKEPKNNEQHEVEIGIIPDNKKDIEDDQIVGKKRKPERKKNQYENKRKRRKVLKRKNSIYKAMPINEKFSDEEDEDGYNYRKQSDDEKDISYNPVNPDIELNKVEEIAFSFVAEDFEEDIILDEANDNPSGSDERSDDDDESDDPLANHMDSSGKVDLNVDLYDLLD